MRLIAGRLIYPVILLFCGVPFVQASPAVKVLKFLGTNSSDQPREHENIVLKVRDLVATSAEFNPASFIITTNDASTLDQDWRALETIELPSQVDDLDGDGKPDEIAFQIPLRARQSRIISVCFGGPGFVARLRGNYILHTRMVAAPQSDSLTWESDLYIWTLHPDNRNAIDLIGKRRPGISSYEFPRDTLRPQSSMFVQPLIT